MSKTTLIYSLNDAFDHDQNGKPLEVIEALGIKYYAAWVQTQDDEIKINGVDPDTIPDPLPPFLRWA